MFPYTPKTLSGPPRIILFFSLSQNSGSRIICFSACVSSGEGDEMLVFFGELSARQNQVCILRQIQVPFRSFIADPISITTATITCVVSLLSDISVQICPNFYSFPFRNSTYKVATFFQKLSFSSSFHPDRQAQVHDFNANVILVDQ